MDMRKFSGQHFIKVADVRAGPMQGQIADVKEGRYDKPDLVFESSDILSLNATNNQTLMRAYGSESDHWIGKQIQMFLGTIQYNGSDQEAVLVKPISPSKQPISPPDDLKGKPSSFDDEVPF